MPFINRREELALVDDHLSRKGAGLFVVYGRRRIGKTALLSAALADRAGAAYHVATRSTIVEELGRLSSTLARSWDNPLLAAQPLTSAEALLAALRATPSGILALDEFPYLVETEPSLPAQLQAVWDQHLSKSELKLILCGSSVAMMEETFFSPRAPLFGRRTGQLRVGPLSPHHLAELFPWQAPALIELAAMFGGVPGYLTRLDPGVDLRTNLRDRLLRRGEPLYEEVPFLLREELREPRVYHAILATIATGSRKFGEIASKVGLDRANLSRYLSVLTDLGLVVRDVPVTERVPDKSRRGLYRIVDPFVATWYALVHPHRDRLERGEAEAVMQSQVEPKLPHFLSTAVESVLVELFRGALRDQVPFPIAHAGRYWSPQVELDVVLLDASREQAFVCEVKWTSRPVGTELLDHLRLRVEREASLAGLRKTFALVSRAGFSGRRGARPDERLVDVSKLSFG